MYIAKAPKDFYEYFRNFWVGEDFSFCAKWGNAFAFDEQFHPTYTQEFKEVLKRMIPITFLRAEIVLIESYMKLKF